MDNERLSEIRAFTQRQHQSDIVNYGTFTAATVALEDLLAEVDLQTNATDEEKRQIAYKLMAWKNDHNQYYGGYYDIPGVGVLHLYSCRKKWEYEWIDIDPLPFLLEEK